MIEIGLAILGNRWGQLILVAISAYFYGFFSVEQPDIARIEANAIAGRDAEWSRRLAAEKETYDQRLAAAVEAAKNEPDTPADMAERLRLCKSSPSCRDKNRR